MIVIHDGASKTFSSPHVETSLNFNMPAVSLTPHFVLQQHFFSVKSNHLNLVVIRNSTWSDKSEDGCKSIRKTILFRKTKCTTIYRDNTNL